MSRDTERTAIAGVEVLPNRDEARDRAWGIWLNTDPEARQLFEKAEEVWKTPIFRNLFGRMWAECWRQASLDAIRRNDQAGILGLELARRLQEHVDLLTQANLIAEAEREAISVYWPSRADLEELPF